MMDLQINTQNLDPEIRRKARWGEPKRELYNGDYDEELNARAPLNTIGH